MSRVRIIGAGFSGLSLGYYLTQLNIPVDIYEKSERLGGLLDTHYEPTGLIETAANGLLNSSHVEELFKDLSIKFAVRPPSRGRRYIFRDNKMRQWPLNFFETARMFTGALALWSQGVHKSVLDLEKLKAWTERQLGESAFQYLVSPAARGIFGTDDLDAELVLKQIFYKKEAKPQLRGTVAPVKGMRQLVEQMGSYIKNNGGQIFLNQNGDVRLSHPTVIATPAPAAALLLIEVAPEFARELLKIEYMPVTSATVHVAAKNKWQGFGCLFPPAENFNAMGVLFNNAIFAERSPDLESETWIMSGADKSDADILNSIVSDRKRLTGIDEKIEKIFISRWPHAIPHYNSKLKSTLATLDKLQLESRLPLYLTGNYLGQLGLAKILKFNKELAYKIKNEMSR